MVELKKRGKHLELRFVCEYGVETFSNIDGFLILQEQGSFILNPIVDYFNLISTTSAQSLSSHLQWIGDAFLKLNVKQLPSTEDGWTHLVLGIYRFIFTRADSNASVKSRCVIWQYARQLLQILQDNDVIPVSIYLPVTKNLDSVDISSYRDQLIGQRPVEKVLTNSVDKLLVPVNFGRPDAIYLDEIRDSLAHRRMILFSVLSDYWSKIKANYLFGEELISTVSLDELKDKCKAYKQFGNELHPCDFRNGLLGLQNTLALSVYANQGYLVTQSDRYPSAKQKQKVLGVSLDEYNFPKGETHTKRAGGTRGALFKHIFSNSSLPPNFLTEDRLLIEKSSEGQQTLNWMIGSLTTSDAAVICSLLIMLNPKFTPASILRAKVYDKNDRHYLIETDGNWSFSLEKRRAKDMKTEELDTLSLEIISTIIEMTAVRRNYLKKVNHPAADLLFLPVGVTSNKLVIGQPAIDSRILSGKSVEGVWLGDYYPELELSENGLGRGTISASKIRATEGVLEWFRTGSLTAMTKRLGNTQKVVLTHYLPKPLLNAWNARLIRRFQNLWIAVASANEPFLLEVTDFNNLADLHVFLKDMLNLHSRTSSPLAEELYSRFSYMSAESSLTDKPDGSLHVAISTHTLSALYTYYYIALNAGLDAEKINYQDALTGLSPRYFIDLAQLLIKVLPEHNKPEFNDAHYEAQSIALNKSSSLGWGQLFAAKG